MPRFPVTAGAQGSDDRSAAEELAQAVLLTRGGGAPRAEAPWMRYPAVEAVEKAWKERKSGRWDGV